MGGKVTRARYIRRRGWLKAIRYVTRARHHECFNQKRAAECRLHIYIHIYIYTRIYWHYAACSNRTRGSLFNPTRAVYLCAYECLRYAMKGLSRRMRYNCTPNLSADSDASMKRTLRYPLFVCRVWEQIKYRILLDIFHSYIFSSPSRFENTRNIKLLDECIK